jgi:hypothetical protein
MGAIYFFIGLILGAVLGCLGTALCMANEKEEDEG